MQTESQAKKSWKRKGSLAIKEMQELLFVPFEGLHI